MTTTLRFTLDSDSNFLVSLVYSSRTHLAINFDEMMMNLIRSPATSRLDVTW